MSKDYLLVNCVTLAHTLYNGQYGQTLSDFIDTVNSRFSQ